MEEQNYEKVCEREIPSSGEKLRAVYEQSEKGSGRVRLYSGENKVFEAVDNTLRPNLPESILIMKLNKAIEDFAYA